MRALVFPADRRAALVSMSLDELAAAGVDARTQVYLEAGPSVTGGTKVRHLKLPQFDDEDLVDDVADPWTAEGL